MTFPPSPSLQPALLTWAQNAAIFACCAVLISTAVASLAFLVFLVLFTCVGVSRARHQLNTAHFPAGLAYALVAYFGWQLIGASYTSASFPDAFATIYSDRKILFIVPLVLLFADERPKKRFLAVFFALAVAGLGASFALSVPIVQDLLALSPVKLLRSSAPLRPENLFRSYATQSMVFAISAFLALWLAAHQSGLVRRLALYVLAAGFLVNIATLTDGRSGYLVVMVLVVWVFAMLRGFKGLAIGGVAALVLGAAAFTFSSSVHNRVMLGVTEIGNFASAPQETSLGRRMVMYQTTLGIIRENPVFGVGTGGFKQAFSAIAAEKYTGWRAQPAEDPHNQYLFILAENGVIGLVAFLAVLAMLLKYALKGGSIYGKMAAGCLLAWCATSLFSGHFRTFPEGHLIAFIVGILMVNRDTAANISQGVTGASEPANAR